MTDRRGRLHMAALGLAVMAAGCAVSPDIVLRDKNGREAVCEHVTGLFGIRTQMLLNVQRQCVEDYQRQGYERVPTKQP